MSVRSIIAAVVLACLPCAAAFGKELPEPVQVAVDGAGNVYAASAPPSGGLARLTVRSVDAGGWSPPREPPGQRFGTEVVPGPGSGAFLLLGDSRSGRVALREITDGALGAQVPLPRGIRYVGQARFAVSADGKLIAVWKDGSRLVAARRSNAGAWTQPSEIARPPTYPLDLELVTTRSGDAIVTWSQGPGGRPPRLHAMTWSPDSGARTSPIAITGWGLIGDFDIEAGPDGEVVVLWTRGGRVETRTWTPAQGWGTVTRLGDGGAGTIDLALATGGRAVATWVRRSEGSARVAVAERLPGRAWRGVEDPPREDGAACEPRAAVTELEVTVAWLVTRACPTEPGHEQAGRLVAATQVASAFLRGWSTPVALEEAARSPRLVRDGSGAPVAVWLRLEGPRLARMRSSSKTAFGGWRPAQDLFLTGR